MRIFVLIMLILSILATSVAAQYPGYLHTCATSTGHGLLQDLDCDKVPDNFDNCIEIPNADQIDSNNDGVGNACAELYGLPIQSTGRTAGTVGLRVLDKQTSGITDAKVKIIEIQDLLVDGPGAVYPIKITNNARTAKRFVLGAEGVNFGTFRVDPSTVIIVEPGQSRSSYLHVLADAGTKEGQYSFSMSVESDGEVEQVTLVANVLTETSLTKNWGNTLGWTLVVVMLIVLAVILVNEFRGRNKPKLGEDIYSYY